MKRDIQVPYVFQCPASGIEEKGVHEVLWYERNVEDFQTSEQQEAGERLVLRFGAVDYEAKVWVDGQFYGGHRGGHVPFDVDITDAFTKGKTHRLTVRVFDSAHDLTQPRGKQYWKAQPESIFYTPSGGIWQNVWLESVPTVRIGDASTGTLLRSNDIEGGNLHASIKVLGRPAGHNYSVELEVSLGGVVVSKTGKTALPQDADIVTLALIRSKTRHRAQQNMGFNGCRKHQKVEDPLFHYWADRLGFLVWGEMANAYAFSEEYVQRMDQEWREAVLRDRNHPCIVAWTPVNESWAYTDLGASKEQRDHIRSLYYATKVLDPTRPVNDNCGWEHVVTDLTTFHDYADADELTNTCKTLDGILGKKANRPMFLAPIENLADTGSEHTPGAPVICTEFGGVNIAREAAVGGDEDRTRDWGYTTATDPKDLLKRIEKMMKGIVEGGHCCGFVYTQLTDIEQEVNGVYTPDREEKLDAAEVKKVVENAMETYAQMHK
ncbi:hypothetical protein P3342_010445 [Pyrenophora teres f. teres]|nr:hypothetical protein P3342_010445 [Pyrenophora teres f. teres]